MKTNFFRVSAINNNTSSLKLDKSEQSLENRRFTCTSSANDTNFHSSFHGEAEIFDTWFQTWSIPHGYVVKGDLANLRPVL